MAQYFCQNMRVHNLTHNPKPIHRSIPVGVTTWDRSPKLPVFEFWVGVDVDAEGAKTGAGPLKLFRNGFQWLPLDFDYSASASAEDMPREGGII